jgi:hypothetical protein
MMMYERIRGVQFFVAVMSRISRLLTSSHGHLNIEQPDPLTRGFQLDVNRVTRLGPTFNFF